MVRLTLNGGMREEKEQIKAWLGEELIWLGKLEEGAISRLELEGGASMLCRYQKESDGHELI